MAMGDDIVAQLPMLRAWAMKLCGKAVEADDLVQETALRALTKQHQFEPGTNLRAWLMTIMKNRFVELRRRAGRMVEDPEGAFVSHLASQENQHAALEAKDTISHLVMVERNRMTAVILAAFGNQIDEIAKMTGVPEGTVKSRINRGRTMLAELTGESRPGSRTTTGDTA